MFSFGSQSSPFDEAVEKATAETLMEENWGLMMDINDKVSFEGQKGCKNVLLAIRKRLNNRDPHVVIYALSLLDCLWKNAGVEFRRCVSSKDFISELRDKSISSITAVANKACQIIKEWSENECAKDPSLALVSSLFKELKDQDLFVDNSEPKKTKQVYSEDPNVANNAEEEAQLAQAIAASLNDVGIKKTQPASNQYPSLSQMPASNNAPQTYREVKALYDFEAAEDNELNLRTGDIVTVYDDSDPNWWKGQSHRGGGLFPSSFVSGTEADNNVNYTNGNGSVDIAIEEPPVQIDEEALMKCIQLLEECDPTGETPDPPALAYFENMALQMAPLIDKKLADIDRQHNMLANVDIAMRDVLASYDQAVQQVQIPQMPQMYNGFPQQGYNMPGNGPQQSSPFPVQNYGQFNPSYPSMPMYSQQAGQFVSQPSGFPPQQYQQFPQTGQAYPFHQQSGLPPTSNVNVSQGMSYPPQHAHQATPPPAAQLVHPQQQYQQFTQTGQAYPFSQQSGVTPPASDATMSQAPPHAFQQVHQATPPPATQFVLPKQIQPAQGGQPQSSTPHSETTPASATVFQAQPPPSPAPQQVHQATPPPVAQFVLPQQTQQPTQVGQAYPVTQHSETPPIPVASQSSTPAHLVHPQQQSLPEPQEQIPSAEISPATEHQSQPHQPAPTENGMENAAAEPKGSNQGDEENKENPASGDQGTTDFISLY